MASQTVVTIQEFCTSHHLENSYLLELERFGLIELQEQQYIPVESLPKVEKIYQFHRELDINLEGVEVILNLLDRVQQQDEELRFLKNRLRRFE